MLRRNSRSTAELDTRRRPLGVIDVLPDILQREADRHHPHRVRVRLSKDSAQPRDLLRLDKRHLLGVDCSRLLDPVVTDLLNLDQIVDDDGLVVRKVEAEFGRGDERAFLVDVVAEHFAERKVEDVGTGVVVPDRPATELKYKLGSHLKRRKDSLPRRTSRGPHLQP